jgi:hypothetical protein
VGRQFWSNRLQVEMPDRQERRRQQAQARNEAKSGFAFVAMWFDAQLIVSCHKTAAIIRNLVDYGRLAAGHDRNLTI